MYSRSIRKRLGARVVSVKGSGSLARRRSRRAGYPLSRNFSTYRYGPASNLFASGVPGSMRRVAGSRAGRELPLYLSSTRELVEAHYVDTAVAQEMIDTTGAVTLLNGIAAGTLITQRDGARCFMTTLQIRGTIYTGSATTVSTGTWMIVYDRAPVGVLPAVTDILDTVSIASFQKTQNRDRFLILYRREISLEGPNSAPTSDSQRTLDISISIRRPCTFSTAVNSGSIADVRSGALYLVTLGSAPTGANQPLIYSCNHRLCFAP